MSDQHLKDAIVSAALGAHTCRLALQQAGGPGNRLQRIRRKLYRELSRQEAALLAATAELHLSK